MKGFVSGGGAVRISVTGGAGARYTWGGGTAVGGGTTGMLGGEEVASGAGVVSTAGLSRRGGRLETVDTLRSYGLHVTTSSASVLAP